MNRKTVGSSAIIAFLITALPFSAHALSEQNSQVTESVAPVPMEDVERFSNALNLIKKYYVNKTNDNTLFNNAIKGMLSGLDAHSSYLDESDFADLQIATNGEFGGLGIEVTMEDGVIKVISPLNDTPASKAGIKSGDLIIKLGSTSVQGLELKDAVNLMRGPIGSTIVLTVVRKGALKPLTFSIVREKIMVKSVTSNLLDDHYGYVRLSQFQALTEKDMQHAIAALKVKSGGKLKGFVLDLRNNPGGLLTSAIDVSDTFLGSRKDNKKEVIVYTQGRIPGANFTALSSQPQDILDHAPMVVLINNGSASASEIVAGALKDLHRAIILGTRSFGKGSVQTVLPLDEKRGIKLTTALYYTPSGTSIQARGITPDVVVEEITLAKTQDATNTANFSEADLKGHLANGNTKSTIIASAVQSSADEARLLRTDFQLYSALTLLKGLTVAQQ